MTLDQLAEQAAERTGSLAACADRKAVIREALEAARTTESYYERVPTSDSPLRPAYTLAMAQLQDSRDQWKARAEELAEQLEAQREQLEQAQAELDKQGVPRDSHAAEDDEDLTLAQRIECMAAYADEALENEEEDHNGTRLRAEKAEQQLAQVTKEQQRYIGFIRAIMRSWPEGDMDGGELQDVAHQHGILELHAVTEPCRPESESGGCQCAEYGHFPTTCYRLTEPFLAKQPTGATK